MVITGVAGVVGIAYSPTTNSTPLYTAVTGFVTISAGQMLVLLRIEQAHAEISKTREAGENTEKKIEQTDQKIDMAAQELVNKPTLTAEEVERIVEAVCRRVLKEKR